MSKALFITATGTDVGKTFVSALLVKKLHQAGLSTGYYKPALSGLSDPVLSDVEYVKQTSQITQPAKEMLSYSYQRAVSPHLAAQLEGNPLELDVIQSTFERLANQYEYLTVEGCGGIICPLRYDSQKQVFLVDLIKALHLKTIVVTSAALGSINAAMLTIEYLKQQGVGILGIIINKYQADDLMQQDNKKMIEQMSNLPILSTVATNAQDIDIDVTQLTDLYKRGAAQ